MQTNVANRLAEEPIQDIQRLIYRPSIEGMDDAGFGDMCALNEAHLVMLAECGLYRKEAAARLAGAIATMRREGRAALPADPTIEDPYYAFETRLAEIVGGDLAGRLHMGRSRNDLGATLARMHARRDLFAICDALNGALAATLDKAAEHAATVVPGHTHLQPAQPITYGFYLASLVTALQRDGRRVAASLAAIDASSLGCAAMGGTSFPIDRHRTAALLGFSGIAEPGLDAVSSYDFATELLFATTSLMTTLSRACQDLYIQFSHEFSSIDLPDRIAGTSSIMPQKKNPIALEYLRGEASRAIGALISTLSAFKGTNFSVAIDVGREGLYDLWTCLERTPGDLGLFARIIEGVRLREEKLLARCRSNFATATDLADGLVREADIPFRDAHHIVGGVVRAAVEAGLGADGITAEMVEHVALAVVGRRLGITDDFVRTCLDPTRAVAGRVTAGGTSTAEVVRVIGACRARLEADVAWLAARREGLAQASNDLAAGLEALAAGAAQQMTREPTP